MRSPLLALILVTILGLLGGALATGARQLDGEERRRSPQDAPRGSERVATPDGAYPRRLPASSPACRAPCRRGSGTRGRSGSPRIRYRESLAVGLPEAGSLDRGVLLPPAGRHYFTWDPIERRSPSRAWRRWGTDELVRTVVRVIGAHRREHPHGPRVGVGDLSRPHGGSFGPEFGGIGHASHQNGLDADVYYPRLDRAERPPLQPGQVDQRLAQDLVDRFVAAGAVNVFVGPSLSLRGPAGTVSPLANHDNHLHVRIPAD